MIPLKKKNNHVIKDHPKFGTMLKWSSCHLFPHQRHGKTRDIQEFLHRSPPSKALLLCDGILGHMLFLRRYVTRKFPNFGLTIWWFGRFLVKKLRTSPNMAPKKRSDWQRQNTCNKSERWVSYEKIKIKKHNPQRCLPKCCLHQGTHRRDGFSFWKIWCEHHQGATSMDVDFPCRSRN